MVVQVNETIDQSSFYVNLHLLLVHGFQILFISCSFSNNLLVYKTDFFDSEIVNEIFPPLNTIDFQIFHFILVLNIKVLHNFCILFKITIFSSSSDNLTSKEVLIKTIALNH